MSETITGTTKAIVTYAKSYHYHYREKQGYIPQIARSLSKYLWRNHRKRYDWIQRVGWHITKVEGLPAEVVNLSGCQLYRVKRENNTKLFETR